MLFQARDFGIGFVEFALRRMQGVARREVIAAQLLEPRLRGAQLRLHRLERREEARELGAPALSRTCRILLSGKPEKLLGAAEAAFELAIFGRDFGLGLEPGELIAELLANVLDPGEILSRGS